MSGIAYYHDNDDEDLCLAECQDGFYGDASDNLCKACHDFCSRCFGPLVD